MKPLETDEYRKWSRDLKDVSEMLDDPKLRSEAGAILEQARDVRREVARHSIAPDWELVRRRIYGPLRELEKQIDDEIARREPNDRLLPIDRDPVPEKYQGLVREYYERLSRQKDDPPKRGP